MCHDLFRARRPHQQPTRVLRPVGAPILSLWSLWSLWSLRQSSAPVPSRRRVPCRAPSFFSGVARVARRLAIAVVIAGAILPVGRAPTALAQLAVPTDIDPAALGLSDRPIVAETLGVAFYPPRDALLTTESVNGNTALVLTEQSSPPRWRLRIQPLESTLETPTPKAIVDDHLARLTATRGAAGPAPRVLENAPITVRGIPGHLLMLAEPGQPGSPETVNGWVVLPRGERNFIVLTTLTTSDQLSAFRAQLDASLSTMSIASLDKLNDLRRTRIETADEILNDFFTPAHLRSVCGERTWYRIYKPATTPGGADREIGYMAIQAVEAMIGELEPSRSRTRLTGDEAQPGLMVIVQARALLDETGKHTLDIDGRYWLAWDRTSEAWSNRSTERQGKAERGFKQTGVRSAPSTGQPRPTLTVINDSTMSKGDTRPQQWAIPPKGYLSQAEVLLLGSLLPRDRGDLELSFFFFDTKEGRMPQRLDRWAKAADGSGNWVLTSQPSLDAPPITQVFDARGTRIRRVDADGTVTERIDPTALLSLWKSKGLPTS